MISILYGHSSFKEEKETILQWIGLQCDSLGHWKYGFLNTEIKTIHRYTQRQSSVRLSWKVSQAKFPSREERMKRHQTRDSLGAKFWLYTGVRIKAGVTGNLQEWQDG